MPRLVLLFELALLRFELRHYVLLQRLRVAQEEGREQRLRGLGNQRDEECADLLQVKGGPHRESTDRRLTKPP